MAFFLAIFYRSASLYHPQRRAILHLKSQKRKVKEKKGPVDKPAYWDFSVLAAAGFRVLLLCVCITSAGIYAPLFYIVSSEMQNHIIESIVITVKFSALLFMFVLWVL